MDEHKLLRRLICRYNELAAMRFKLMEKPESTRDQGEQIAIGHATGFAMAVGMVEDEIRKSWEEDEIRKQQEEISDEHS
jgi:hypothetical protein